MLIRVFLQTNSKRGDLYKHTRSRATNIVYIHTTKTTVYKTYTWCKGRESLLGNATNHTELV